jgi:hypothetical protein
MLPTSRQMSLQKHDTKASLVYVTQNLYSEHKTQQPPACLLLPAAYDWLFGAFFLV